MASFRIILFLLLASTSVQAQTFAEWFKQKSTQKKYLLQQIAALQVYTTYLNKGYHIAKGGLGSISGAVGREFQLHTGYYDDLKTVGSPIKNNSQVRDILRWQQDILNQCSAMKKQSGLTVPEAAYVSSVCEAVLKDCDSRLLDLRTVLADHKIGMTDEERLGLIARLHEAMQDNYRFAASFGSEVSMYAQSKQQEKNDLITINSLYENP
jgi:hypothetical protein